MTDRSATVRLRADISDFQRGMMTAGASASAFAKNLEQADSRMANLVQTGLALAPALVPISAAAVPAIAGLSLQLGVAGIAAGTALLAFNGVGDGLKALNDYQLNPTAANFEKLQQKMGELGPAGQDFVLSLDKMQPKLQGLQDIAQAGMLPGVTEGLDEVLKLMPQAQSIVGTFSTTLGNLAAEAGDNLNDPKWLEFFDYLSTTGGPVLTEMGHTLGNLTEGLANMLMAFDPLSRSFSTGFADMASSFAGWSANLSSSQGFQEFLDYISTNGPKALDALGSIGNALVELVEAAAPVGSALLPAISGIADVFASIADSPVGPVIVGAAAAVGTLGRSMALLQAVGLRSGAEGKQGILGNILGTDKLKSSIPTMAQAGTAFMTFGQSSKFATEESLKAKAAVGGFLKSAAPTAGMVAGLAVASTGLGESMGISNTATLALMASMGGIPAIAGGAVVGALIDAAGANNSFMDSLKNSQAVIRQQPGDLEAQAQAIAATREQYEGFRDSLGKDGNVFERFAKGFTPGALKNFTEDAFGDSDIDEMKDKLKDLQAEAKAAQQAFAFGNVGTGVAEGLGAGLGAIQTVLADTVGKASTAGAAIAELGNGMESTATQAEALGGALDALFGTEIDQQAATDAWAQSLADLRKQLDGSSGVLTGQTAAARENRAAMRGSASALLQKVKADAEAGVSGDKLVGTLVNGREAMIQAGMAAGRSRAQMVRYVATLGLTPRNIETIITTSNVLSATQKVRALTKLYGQTPKTLSTMVRQFGADPTIGKVRALARQFNLTPRQVLTLLRAEDKASSKAKNAQRAIDGMKDKSVSIRAKEEASAKAARAKAALASIKDKNVQVNTRADLSGAHAAQAAVNSVQSRTVTVTTHFVRTGSPVNPGAQAVGGFWSGGVQAFAGGGTTESGAYVPRVSQMRQGQGRGVLWGEQETGWEAYISGKSGQEDRNRDIWRMAGERLGVDFEEFALGGMRTYAKGGSHKGGGGGDFHRKAPKGVKDKNYVTFSEWRQGVREFNLAANMSGKELRAELRDLRKEFNLGGKTFRDLQQRAYRVSKAYDRQEKALDRNREKLSTLRSDRSQYRDEVTGAYSHDRFGNGIEGLRIGLEADRNDARDALKYSKILDKKGVSQGLQKDLLASGDLNTLSQLATLSKGDLAEYSKLYGQTTKATGELGKYAGDDQYKKAIDRTAEAVKDNRKAIHRLNHLMEHIEDRIERGARNGVLQNNRATASRIRAGGK